MLPFIMCFCLSSILIWLGENNRKYFITSRIFFLLALIIPAALAGLRDFSVGIDVVVYVKPFFDDVVSSPNLNALDPKWDLWIEPGYRWLNFVVAIFTDDVHWFFFWIVFLQSSFVFLGLYTYRDKMPLWLGMLCYYFLFFCYSLCAVRESLAMSMLFFASRYLLNKSYIKYAIVALVLVLFHKSALLAFLLIPLHIYVSKFESDRAKFILITCFALFFLFLEKILNLILEILQMEYLLRALYYLEGETEFTWRTHAILIAVFILPFAFFYWKRKKMYSIGKEYHFFFAITAVCLLVSQLITFGPHTARMATVFKWLLILILPMSLAVYKGLPNKQFLLKISVACYAVYYWFFTLVYRNREEVLPYSSSFLNSIF